MSSRREPNQPSSSTYRSTPTAAARSARSSSRSRSWSKYTASQTFRVTGRSAETCGSPGPQVPVEAAGDLVQAVPYAPYSQGLGIAVAGGQPDLAGQQQLAAAEHLLAGEDPLGVVGVVAAPRGVHRPDLAGREAEPGGARRAARTRCPAPVRPLRFSRRWVPVVKAAPLRHPLPVVPAGEVEQLDGLGRHREGQHQIVEGVRLRGQVAHQRPGPQQPGREQLQGQRQLQAPGVVGGRNSSRPAPPARKPATGAPSK